MMEKSLNTQEEGTLLVARNVVAIVLVAVIA